MHDPEDDSFAPFHLNTARDHPVGELRGLLESVHGEQFVQHVDVGHFAAGSGNSHLCDERAHGAVAHRLYLPLKLPCERARGLQTAQHIAIGGDLLAYPWRGAESQRASPLFVGTSLVLSLTTRLGSHKISPRQEPFLNTRTPSWNQPGLRCGSPSSSQTVGVRRRRAPHSSCHSNPVLKQPRCKYGPSRAGLQKDRAPRNHGSRGWPGNRQPHGPAPGRQPSRVSRLPRYGGCDAHAEFLWAPMGNVGRLSNFVSRLNGRVAPPFFVPNWVAGKNSCWRSSKLSLKLQHLPERAMLAVSTRLSIKLAA